MYDNSLEFGAFYAQEYPRFPAKTWKTQFATRRGTVIHGQKIGRELGIPTANIRLRNEGALKFGVYAVTVDLLGRRYKGVASFGTRPQFDDGLPLLEVHLFDFRGYLYGRQLTVHFVEYLRAEETFPTLNAFLRQVEADIRQAQGILGMKNVSKPNMFSVNP